MTDKAEKSDARSRRVVAGHLDVDKLDIFATTEDEKDRPPRPGKCGYGESLFMIAQIITVVIIGLTCDYGTGTTIDKKTKKVVNNGNGILPSSPQPPAGEYDVNKDFI